MSCRRAAAVLLLLAVAGSLSFAAPQVRIKEIAQVLGVRDNQLLGVGLVTGLAGRGDSAGSGMLQQALSNLVSSFGLRIDAEQIKSRNAAMVMVSAEMPPFARPGERIDLAVSSMADARSLEGGILLQTNLRAANGLVYAVAQGPIAVAAGRGSVPTVGTIKAGAIVEREVLSEFAPGDRLSFVLTRPDFVTAAAVAAAIREALPDLEVLAPDAAMVQVQVPQERRTDVVALIGQIEALTVTPDTRGRVVIDSQSGIVIMGENVRIGKVAVSYKTVDVTVGAAPALFTGAEEKPNHFVIEESTSVDQFVSTLRAVGLDTEVLIGILKALDRAGALFGTLIVL